MNSVHGSADCQCNASAYVLILRLVCMNANHSKDILNLDVVFDYDSNFGYFLPFSWVLMEVDLAIKFPLVDVKGGQDSLFHQLLHL